MKFRSSIVFLLSFLCLSAMGQGSHKEFIENYLNEHFQGKAYEYVLINKSTISSGKSDSLSRFHCNVKERLIPYLTWQAVSNGELRLNNQVNTVFTAADSIEGATKFAQLLDHTSGFVLDEQGGYSIFDETQRDSFNLNPVNIDLLSLLIPRDDTIHYKLESEAYQISNLEELLTWETKVLAGEGLIPAFQSKISQPRVFLGKKGFGNGWFFRKLTSETDTIELIYQISELDESFIFTAHLPSSDFCFALRLKGLADEMGLIQLLASLSNIDNSQKIFKLSDLDHEFLVILALLTALALIMFLMNQRTSKRRKAFKAGNNMIVVLVLLTCIAITVLLVLDIL